MAIEKCMYIVRLFTLHAHAMKFKLQYTNTFVVEKCIVSSTTKILLQHFAVNKTKTNKIYSRVLNNLISCYESLAKTVRVHENIMSGSFIKNKTTVTAYIGHLFNCYVFVN